MNRIVVCLFILFKRQITYSVYITDIIHNIILGHLSTDISFLVRICVTCWIICTVNNWNAQEWTEKVDLHIIHSDTFCSSRSGHKYIHFL